MDDIEAIKQLKARYFRLMDTKDWHGLEKVFTEDVVIDVTEEGAGIRHSAAEHIEKLVQLLANAISCHHGHMPEIELTSPTTAKGIWAMEDRVWWPDADQNRSDLWGLGHYHETYEKVDGEWRIKTLKLTRLRREFR